MFIILRSFDGKVFIVTGFRGDKLCVSGQETDERKRIFKNEKKN